MNGQGVAQSQLERELRTRDPIIGVASLRNEVIVPPNHCPSSGDTILTSAGGEDSTLASFSGTLGNPVETEVTTAVTGPAEEPPSEGEDEDGST